MSIKVICFNLELERCAIVAGYAVFTGKETQGVGEGIDHQGDPPVLREACNDFSTYEGADSLYNEA